MVWLFHGQTGLLPLKSAQPAPGDHAGWDECFLGAAAEGSSGRWSKGGVTHRRHTLVHVNLRIKTLFCYFWYSWTKSWEFLKKFSAAAELPVEHP